VVGIARFDMRPQVISGLVIATLLAGLAYLQLSSRQGPMPPTIPVVSGCKDPKPGTRRIRGRLDFKNNFSRFQFDVPAEVAISREGWAMWDAPAPPLYSITLTHGNSESYLHISWGDETIGMGRPPIDPVLATPPGYFESHKVLDDKGKRIGEEFWGYRDNGERWRRIHLIGSLNARYGSEGDKDVTSYGSVHELDAALFDQIINSVCVDE